MDVAVLRDEFDRGVLDQIAIGDRSQAVADAIGNAGARIGGFRGLLYHLLTTQADAIILALGRLFDPPSRKYPTRGILGFLDLLEKHSDAVKVLDGSTLQEFLDGQGRKTDGLNATGELVRAFVLAYRALLHEPTGSSREEPAAVLARIRARRDKQVAHNENWEPRDDERATWNDGRSLLAEAKGFAILVGSAFLGMDYTDTDGAYSVTAQSRMIGKQAERMLELVRQALMDR